MNNDSLERLDLLSDLLQVLNTYLLLRDATNNQLMQELQHQNTEYFEKITKDLDLIKKELGIKENASRIETISTRKT